MHTYKRLLSSVREYLPLFVIGILATLIASGVDAGFMWFIKPIIDKGFMHRDLLFIKWLPFIIIVIFIIRGIANFLANYTIYRAGRNLVMKFRQQIFAKLLRMPAVFFDNASSGQLLSKLIYNVDQVADSSTTALLVLLREALFAIGLVVVMFIISWQLSLILLLMTPLNLYLLNYSSKRMRHLSTNVQDSVSQVSHIASETIDGYRVVRTFGGETYEQEKFNEATKLNRHRELKITITNSLITASIQLVIALGIAFIIYFATLPSQNLSAGSFGAIIGSMVSLLRPIRRLTNVNQTIQKGIAGATSVFELLDGETESDEGNLRLTRTKGNIQFSQVNFAYPSSNKLVLDDINIQIKPGEIVAIVGRSGSGKSTLVNLLLRFYEPKSGIIQIDGVNIQAFKLKELRRQFAFVSQDISLFNDTIAANIAYGCDRDVAEEKIINAAKAAYAWGFITELSEGLNTIVGEDGVLLSGGQRQRIALARAIIKKAPIMIIDEATSALDSESEFHIQKALEKLMHKCTTIIIAHRLSTIEKANRIILMDQGQVLEKGSHQALLDKSELYRQLYKKQFGEDNSLINN